MTIAIAARVDAAPIQASDPQSPEAQVWAATTLPREAIVDQAHQLKAGSQTADYRRMRAVSTDRLLTWLETFVGSTWQQRWISSGAEQVGRRWADAPSQFTTDTEADQPSPLVGRRASVQGLNVLLCLGVIRPGYRFLFASRLKHTYDHVRALVAPDFFAEAFAICRVCCTDR